MSVVERRIAEPKVEALATSIRSAEWFRPLYFEALFAIGQARNLNEVYSVHRGFTGKLFEVIAGGFVTEELGSQFEVRLANKAGRLFKQIFPRATKNNYQFGINVYYDPITGIAAPDGLIIQRERPKDFPEVAYVAEFSRTGFPNKLQNFDRMKRSPHRAKSLFAKAKLLVIKPKDLPLVYDQIEGPDTEIRELDFTYAEFGGATAPIMAEILKEIGREEFLSQHHASRLQANV